jgi:RNA polymerase sigma-70 factor, ECF subfamily
MTKIAEVSDETLLRHAARGDEEAFVTLYRRRHASIYRFAFHMSGSAVIAEEVTQEVFVAVIRDGKRFEESRGAAASYLFGVARNHVRKILERDRAYVGLDEESADAAPPGENVLSDLTRAQAIENVRMAVLELPAVYREAVVLCDLEELTYAEAAETLGVPLGTVRSRIARGRAILARKLSSPGNEGSPSLRCFV